MAELLDLCSFLWQVAEGYFDGVGVVVINLGLVDFNTLREDAALNTDGISMLLEVFGKVFLNVACRTISYYSTNGKVIL